MAETNTILAAGFFLFMGFGLFGVYYLRRTDEGDNNLGPGASYFASLIIVTSTVAILRLVGSIGQNSTVTLLGAIIGYTLASFDFPLFD